MNNNRRFTLNTNQNIIVEFTDERIIPAGGLAVVGALLGKSDFAKKLNRMDITKNRSQHQIKNGDIILTYIGMLCMGKPYFEAVHEMDDDKAFYQAALGITRSIPSEETLRQRMDEKLGLIAYNILRMIGQGTIGGRAPRQKRDVKRRRVHTVISNLVMMASHVTTHARQLVMGLGKSNVWRHLFADYCESSIAVS